MLCSKILCAEGHAQPRGASTGGMGSGSPGPPCSVACGARHGVVMRSILTQQSIPRRVRVMPGVVIVASGILAAVFLVVLGRLVRNPEYVAHVELRNERDTLVDVWVRGAEGGPWLPLAPVEPGQRVVVSDEVARRPQAKSVARDPGRRCPAGTTNARTVISTPSGSATRSCRPASRAVRSSRPTPRRDRASRPSPAARGSYGRRSDPPGSQRAPGSARG
jgi:hypothetical protein